MLLCSCSCWMRRFRTGRTECNDKNCPGYPSRLTPNRETVGNKSFSVREWRVAPCRLSVRFLKDWLPKKPAEMATQLSFWCATIQIRFSCGQNQNKNHFVLFWAGIPLCWGTLSCSFPWGRQTCSHFRRRHWTFVTKLSPPRERILMFASWFRLDLPNKRAQEECERGEGEGAHRRCGIGFDQFEFCRIVTFSGNSNNCCLQYSVNENFSLDLSLI